ncbi:MAG TPA: S1 RNA-binding domain-containing protein [Patescibacteria group bacterium]|nr:S1 RNA-binding domain-containing protein [Patescibacteria group bacterium]
MSHLSTTKSSAATSMAELMAKTSSTPVVSLKKGDFIKGILTRLGKKEIFVDIQSKSQAIVLEHDPKMLKNIHSLLKEGQTVEVSVISPESESGQPVVSLRRFISDLIWQHLEALKKSQEKIEVTIQEVTKGGYVSLTKDGITGFLPNSHTTSTQGTLIPGKTISVSIADLNREDNKIIFSQKTTMTPEEFRALLAHFKPGTKVSGEVTSVTSFGYFVTLKIPGTESTIDGLIHVSEVAWERSEDSLSLYKVGDVVEVVVIGVDRDSYRIDLSLKRLQADPFEKVKERFPLEKQVSATVLRTEDGNVYVDLGDIEGLIKKEKVPAGTIYEVGQTVSATVTAHDPRRRRVELTPVLKEKPLMYR